MKEEKMGLILFPDMYEMVSVLDMEERGLLLTAIFCYGLGAEPPRMNKHTAITFGFIRKTMERHRANYRAVCEQNRINGSKGGRPRKAPEGEV